MNFEIKIGDSAKLISELPEESIPLCITSPPYDNLRTYAGHAWDFENTAMQLYRAITPGGIVCWNVGDATINGSETLTSFKQAIFFKEKAGFLVHDTMIYGKTNGSKPTPRRYNQVMEYVFILSKGTPKTVNLIRDKKNATAGKGVFGKHTMREKNGEMTMRKNHIVAAEFGVRGNIWIGNTRGQEEVCQHLPHPAMMPRWLARDLIFSFSNPGDTILDPMAGSGTTGIEAIKIGRNTIMFDADPKCESTMRAYISNTTPGLHL